MSFIVISSLFIDDSGFVLYETRGFGAIQLLFPLPREPLPIVHSAARPPIALCNKMYRTVMFRSPNVLCTNCSLYLYHRIQSDLLVACVSGGEKGGTSYGVQVLWTMSTTVNSAPPSASFFSQRKQLRAVAMCCALFLVLAITTHYGSAVVATDNRGALPPVRTPLRGTTPATDSDDAHESDHGVETSPLGDQQTPNLGVDSPAERVSVSTRGFAASSCQDMFFGGRRVPQSSGAFSTVQPHRCGDTSPRQDDGRRSALPVRRPFRFHVYDIPDRYVNGALRTLEEKWETSLCNRRNPKTNFTMLDWRHAHSLFTTDVFITKYLRRHPAHTADPAQADVFIVPMMTHVYNCASLWSYMVEVLDWVATKAPGGGKYYRAMDHRDHFMFWWRWGMNSNAVGKFWKAVSRSYPNVNIISFDFLELMGRNDYQDFTLALKPRYWKAMNWIVMPYPDYCPALASYAPPLLLTSASSDKKGDGGGSPGGVVVGTSSPLPVHAASRETVVYPSLAAFQGPSNTLSSGAEGTEAIATGVVALNRSVFFYFTGTSTIGGIRRWIKRACDAAGPNDCLFEDFATNVIDTARLRVPLKYARTMKQSIFCGHAAGDSLSSRRPTSAILAGCIPVLICDLCLYPWENMIDYRQFAVFLSEADIMDGKLFTVLRAIPPEEIRRLQMGLQAVRTHFRYPIDGNLVPGDALDMLVWELELRGLMHRQYRRWFTTNADLSSDLRDYPPIPLARKKYVARGAMGAAEEKDFNNLAARKT